MNNMLNPREIEELEKRVRGAEAPEPPEGLLRAIREEIPDELPTAAGESEPGHGRSARRWQALAASLFLAVVGAAIISRVVVREPDAKPDRLEREAPVTQAAGRAADEEPAAAAAAPPSAAKRTESLEMKREELLSSLRKLQEDQGAGGDLAQSSDAASEEIFEADATALAEKRQVGDSLLFQDSGSEMEQPAEEQVVESTEVAVNSGAPERGGSAGTSSAPRDQRADGRLNERLRTMALPMAPPPQAPAVAESAATPRSSELPKPFATARYEAARRPGASTGGTTEPNDQPYGDMFFDTARVNPFIDTEDDALSTFGLDVDSGSYTLVRSYLDRGHMPPPDAVRIEELVNYFNYGDRSPERGDFALSAEGAPTPFGEGERYRVLRFGLHGKVVDAAERAPAVLTFVVDISGSMARENRLTLVKRALHLLLDELKEGDRIGLVVYGSRGEILLEPTGDREAVRAAIERLQSGGSTNAEEGLVLAYDLARKHFRRGGINRVILSSDGVANVGRTGPESILGRIGREAEDGIELTTVGFGMGNYNDLLMEQLADKGDGRYAYVDSLAEAKRLFVEDLTGTLQTIASDAKVQVEFDPQTVSRYRLLGYENRAIADNRFRDDTVDAGEIGAGHQVTALYEVKLTPEAKKRDRIATLHLRYRSKVDGEVKETAREIHVRDLNGSWASASPGLRLASLVAEFGEILKRSYWAREGDLDDVLRRAQALSPAFAGDVKVAEFAGLAGKAAQLDGPKAASGDDR